MIGEAWGSRDGFRTQRAPLRAPLPSTLYIYIYIYY